MRVTILALSLSLIVAPASAANGAAQQGAAASQGATAAKSEARKYCIFVDNAVGTRIRGKMECKTKAEWSHEGVDVDRLLKE